MDRYEAIGAKIREARETAGMSRRAAAKAATISEARWRQIESGRQRRDGVEVPAVTTAETLTLVARAVDLDPQELLDMAGLEPPRPDTGTTQLPSASMDMLSGVDFTPREKELMNMFFEWAREVGLREGRQNRGDDE